MSPIVRLPSSYSRSPEEPALRHHHQKQWIRQRLACECLPVCARYRRWSWHYTALPPAPSHSLLLLHTPSYCFTIKLFVTLLPSSPHLLIHLLNTTYNIAFSPATSHTLFVPHAHKSQLSPKFFGGMATSYAPKKAHIIYVLYQVGVVVDVGVDTPLSVLPHLICTASNEVVFVPDNAAIIAFWHHTVRRARAVDKRVLSHTF